MEPLVGIECGWRTWHSEATTFPSTLPSAILSAAQLRGEVATHFNVIPTLAGRAADPLWPHPCRQEPAISTVAVQPRNNHLTVHLMGVYLTGMYLTGVYVMGVHFIGVHLTGVHLMSVRVSHLMGVYLINVYLTDVHLMSVHLTGLHLMGVPHRPALHGRATGKYQGTQLRNATSARSNFGLGFS